MVLRHLVLVSFHKEEVQTPPGLQKVAHAGVFGLAKFLGQVRGYQEELGADFRGMDCLLYQGRGVSLY